ncbi:MAG: D-alanyl-D-alanine carboxypeptidase, partial [Alphaproteobacteria bacterium]|nr:D-alanyl-D-alanine carboxypeptidase [Alphaproteobacteria bacterium]
MMKFRRNLAFVRYLFSAVVVLICLSMAVPAQAAVKKKINTKKTKARPTAARLTKKHRPNIYADIVIEADTGRILHETNGKARRHPASLTKMMTLYLTFQAIENSDLRLDTPLPVSALAANQAPSKLGLSAGQTIRVYDAIMALVTQSANDAAVVLAEALGSSVDQFAKMMVDQARTLGMRGTFFRNPNGLPNDQQVTTARDMAILGQALVYHYPGFYTYFSRENFVYKGKAYHNHNHLMERYDGMDGIKTGYIYASGFNLVASVVRNNKRLIGVIFGGQSAASRDKAMAQLLDEAFDTLRRGKKISTAKLALPSKVPSALALTGRGRRKATVAARMPLP